MNYVLLRKYYIIVFRKLGCPQKLLNLFTQLYLLNFRSWRVAQLVSALPSVLEVPSSILSNSKVCSDFSLICVGVALNPRKMEH